MNEGELDANCLDTDPNEYFGPESRRYPNVPGVPVVLADGRTWHIAATTLRYKPRFVGNRFAGTDTYRGFPPSCERVTDALAKACETNPDDVPVDLIFDAATSLLRRAHNLSPGETAALLNVDEEGLQGLIKGLERAFLGADWAGQNQTGGAE